MEPAPKSTWRESGNGPKTTRLHFCYFTSFRIQSECHHLSAIADNRWPSGGRVRRYTETRYHRLVRRLQFFLFVVWAETQARNGFTPPNRTARTQIRLFVANIDQQQERMLMETLSELTSCKKLSTTRTLQLQVASLLKQLTFCAKVALQRPLAATIET